MEEKVKKRKRDSEREKEIWKEIQKAKEKKVIERKREQE